MSTSLDPDQARRYVWPDLGPNCLQKFSADDTRRYIVNFGSIGKDNGTVLIAYAQLLIV